MPSLRYNALNSFNVWFSQNRSLLLYPGVNLNVPQEYLDEAMKNPVFRAKVDDGSIDILTKPPTTTLEIEGIPVMDVKTMDQPVPVMPIQDRSPAKLRNKKTESA